MGVVGLETLQEQMYKFVFIGMAGMMGGLLVDVFRAWRLSVSANKMVRNLTDALMVASVFCFLAIATVYGTWGELRFYTLVALLLGLGSYFYLASSPVLWAFCRIFALSAWFWGHIVRVVLIPIRWLGRNRKDGTQDADDDETDD